MASRPEAGERLRRLLAILAWLARQGRAPVGALAERFGITPEELVADLELAACCGLPPYTPDQLMEIVIEEDEVVAHLGLELARPRRLSAAEGFALATAARAIVDVPGADPDGALARALEKLDAVLGDRQRLVVELDEPPYLEALRAAAGAGRQVEIDYHSASHDDTTTRVVDPWVVFTRDGHWYLDAYCHRSGGVRRFRVDRVQSVSDTGEANCHQDEDSEEPPGGPFVPGPDVIVATLALDSEGAWVTETIPILEARRLVDGRNAVSLAVVGPAWFERLLLQLGPHAEVLSPAELVGAGARAASRLLERYRTGEHPASISGEVGGEHPG
jgi:proteasome accessory factor C